MKQVFEIVAQAYTQFAPSLQLFAQYGAQNSNLLNTIKRNERQLSELLPGENHFEKSLISPLIFYPYYKQELKEYVSLVPPTDASYKLLSDTLALINTQSDNIDLKMKDEEERLQLLALQNNFTGNPIIFTPTRKIVKEGEFERLKKTPSDEIGTHVYYSHLFNDAFIYSAR